MTRVVLLLAAVVALAAAGAGCGWETNPSYCCVTPSVCMAPGGSPGPVPCTDPERPFCDEEHRRCVPDPVSMSCQGPGDCTNPDRPFCVDRRCRQCDGASGCTPSAPMCDVGGTYMCGPCGDHDDCAGFPALPRCETGTGACVECVVSGDCAMEFAPVCDDGTNTCRACRAHGECASEVCEESSGACVAEATIIYVATNGNDAGDCPQTAPCRTIGYALGRVSAGRRTIRMRQGTYTEQVSIAGATVTLVGDGATLEPGALNQSALAVSNGADVLVRGLTIQGTGGGSNPSGVVCQTAGGTPTLALRGTTVRNNGGPGVSATNCTVSIERSMIIANTGGGVSISGGTFTLVNNFIVRNGGPDSLLGGVSISQISGAGTRRLDFNTITDNQSSTGVTPGILCGVVTTPVTIANSIVYGNGTGTQLGGNAMCAATYSNIGPMGVAGTGNINMAPLFVDAPNRNYHLQPTSPGVDAADPAASVPVDFDGDERPQGGRSDMGADEVVN